MKIAIFGATSQIAKDLILSFSDEHKLELFSRDVTSISRWMTENNLSNFNSRTYFDFSNIKDFDVIINFVGVGSPERLQKMGKSIVRITETFDRLAMEYLDDNKDCLYIFMSSGAAFGDNFLIPADIHKIAAYPLNDLQPQHYYGLAKFMAEVRHRMSERNIIDLRVYNYFSHTCNLEYKYMINDMIKCIQDGSVYKVDRTPIMRDYIGPLDFYQMINVLMSKRQLNTAIDCYSRQPVTKDNLLAKMAERYGLLYETVGIPVGLAATGVKEKYYSTNTAAYALGYRPTLTSLENVIIAADKILK